VTWCPPWRPSSPSSGARPEQLTASGQASTAFLGSTVTFHAFFLRSGSLYSITVLRIHDILVRIRIRKTMLLTNGSGSGSFYFHHWPSRCQRKTYLKKSFSACYFLKVRLHHFSKLKSQKDVRNSRYQGFSYYFSLMIEGSGVGSGCIPLTNGSGSRRPKNTWIRIRIRNTAVL
jgi:hypothetical protein